MRKLFYLVSMYALHLTAQTNHRIFPQSAPSGGSYIVCDLNPILKTSDNGYLISANPWSPNIHSAYPLDHLTIKTNSVLVPVWKKGGYIKSHRLASGRIIAMQQSINNQVNSISQLTKMDNAGQAIWTKSITVNLLDHYTELRDFAVNGNKIMAVGADFYNDPWFTNSSQIPFITELDTNGTVQNIYVVPSMSTSSTSRVFDRIVRFPTGDYLISDLRNYALHKYSSTLNNIFSIQHVTRKFKLVDAFMLSTQEIFCLLQNDVFYQGDTNSVLLKLGPTGTFISCFEIPLFAKYGGMEKTATGKFIITGITYRKNSSDTIRNFVMMVDSNGTFQWGRKQLTSIGISKPFCEGNKIMYSFYNKNLSVVTGDQNGNFPCSNVPMNVTLVSKLLSFSNAPLNLVTTQMTQTTGFSYSNTTQTYVDTCSSITTGFSLPNISRVSIGPNPTGGLIHFSSDQNIEGLVINLYSINGKLEKETIVKQNTLDLSDLKAGIYLMKFQLPGEAIQSRKVIIAK